MCSLLAEVLGAHRSLVHESAAKELVISWDGTEPFHADSIVALARVVLRTNCKTPKHNDSTVTGNDTFCVVKSHVINYVNQL